MSDIPPRPPQKNRIQQLLQMQPVVPNTQAHPKAQTKEVINLSLDISFCLHLNLKKMQRNLEMCCSNQSSCGHSNTKILTEHNTSYETCVIPIYKENVHMNYTQISIKFTLNLTYSQHQIVDLSDCYITRSSKFIQSH